MRSETRAGVSASGRVRAVSIRMLTSSDRARWHFLEENATRQRAFCKDQNQNRFNRAAYQAAYQEDGGNYWTMRSMEVLDMVRVLAGIIGTRKGNRYVTVTWTRLTGALFPSG